MRKLLVRVCLALISIAFAFAIAEIFLLLLERFAPQLSPGAVATATVYPETAETAGLQRLKPSAFNLMKPNQRGTLSTGAFYRTNSLGIRGPEYSPVPDPDVFRIVISGDSLTMGAGVSEKDAYPGHLEDLLNRDATGRRYQVVNLGIAGLNAEAIAQRTAKLLPLLDPQLLIYGFTVNDIEDGNYQKVDPAAAKRWWQHTQGMAQLPTRVLRFAASGLLSIRQYLSPHEGSYVFELQQNYFENAAAWDAFIDAIERMKALADERAICMVLFIHTCLDRLNALHPLRHVYERVSDAALERGLFVVPSFEKLSGRTGRSLWLRPTDSHPNRVGHVLYAEALASGIRALPQQCLAGGGSDVVP